ncbi:T9SS type A sorting domain-containing protein [Flaviaesturariibacter amylovorans]|uniref:Secretion system C-terminal sorting domain-containing protein n=1 Tax=Flaviaesturariibacter amylovorans TaxID=1084520 RepID=A0ABP8GPJ6_9BACT
MRKSFERLRYCFLLLLLLLATRAHAQTWDWANTAGNFGPTTNTWGYVTNHGLAQDNSGNIIVYGEFFDSLRIADTFIVTRTGADHFKSVFLAKFAPSGARLWTRVYRHAEGAWSGSLSSQVQVDTNGDIILAGRADTGFAGQSVPNKHFVCKMRDDGQLLWMKLFDNAPALTIDAAGSVYVAVTYYSTFTTSFDNIPVPGANQLLLGKLSAGGNALWLKRYPMDDIGNNWMKLQVSPSGSELLMAGVHSKSLTIDGIPLTMAATDNWKGFVGRFSVADGAVKKIIPVYYFGNSFFELANARWVGNNRIVFTGANNSFPMQLVVNGVTLDGGFHPTNKFVYTTLMDTAGTVAWFKVIKAANPVNGFNTTYSRALEVAGNYIYVAGAAATNSTINGSNINPTYGLSSSFVACYDLSGNVVGFTNGGFTHSDNMIVYMVFTPQQKLFVSGTHRGWIPGSMTPAFNNLPVPQTGNNMLLFGRLTAPGVFTSVPALDADTRVTLYPNPARDRMQVTIITTKPAATRLEIINGVGQPVLGYEAGVPSLRYSQQVGLNGLPPGIYYLKVTMGKSSSVQAFVHTR